MDVEHDRSCKPRGLKAEQKKECRELGGEITTDAGIQKGL
jgi:hypothetical protein